MSETLPSHQNEPQPWQRELSLHREGAGTLKPEEALALVGSFTESSLEGFRYDNETGSLSDQSLSMKERIHAAALEQLGALKAEQDVGVLDIITDRQKEL